MLMMRILTMYYVPCDRFKGRSRGLVLAPLLGIVAARDLVLPLDGSTSLRDVWEDRSCDLKGEGSTQPRKGGGAS